MEILTQSAQDTQKLGQKMAVDLVKEVGETAKIITLYGELGSGKTTLVQGIAKGLSIPHRIISPTFIILRRYSLQFKNFQAFYHIDLYRIESPAELEGLGFDEIFRIRNNMVVIEWAERLGNLLPKERIDIRFKQIPHDMRKITIGLQIKIS